MTLLNLFTKQQSYEDKTSESSSDVPVTTSSKESNNDASEDNKNFITIMYGTGLPIDVIFNYIHKDRENEGYQDALVNSDITYQNTKVTIIRNDLKMLFRRVALRYHDDIRIIDVQIENARQACLMSSVSMMQARKQTYEEHLSEISNMEKLLDVNDPKMTSMIESYKRGFLKGIAANTQAFINIKK